MLVKNNENLNKRYVVIVPVKDGNNPATDGKNDIKAEVVVEASLPFFTMPEKFLDKVKYMETTSLDTDVSKISMTLHDPEYYETNGKFRFIFMGGVRSPQTEDVVRFYYDRLYQDIIIMPDLDFFEVDAVPTMYMLRAYSVGYMGNSVSNLQITDSIPTSDANKFNIPEPVPGTKIRCTATWINNTSKNTKYRSLEIAKVLPNGTQLNTTFVDYTMIITFETPDKLFNNVNAGIPHYIFFQASTGNYNLKRQGVTSIKGNPRIHLTF